MTTYKPTLRAVGAAFAFFALANCGGGTTSSDTGNGFADIQQTFLDLSDRLDTLDPTNPIPTSDQVDYSGAIVVFETADALSLADTADLDALDISFLTLGEVELSVDFGAASLSGTATNFFELTNPNAAVGDNSAGSSIEGSLEVDASGTVTGELTKLDGEVASYNLVDGDAGFVGPDADVLLGVAIGTSEANGRGDLNAGTVFAAER